MKKFDEEEDEDFCEEEYFNFEDLIFSEEKSLWIKIFAQDGVSLAELKIDFSENFLLKLLRLKILKIVGFDQFFIPTFRTKRVITFDKSI